MHFHDAERSHAPSLALVVAWVMAHALVPLPVHASLVHVVASVHVAPHFPQFDASSRTHAPAQQKYFEPVGQSAGVLHPPPPHATLEAIAHMKATAAATNATRAIGAIRTASPRGPSPCMARS